MLNRVWRGLVRLGWVRQGLVRSGKVRRISDDDFEYIGYGEARSGEVGRGGVWQGKARR